MTFAHLSEALPQLATPAEVAPHLHLTIEGVRRQCASGKLPGVKVGGRWLVHVAKLAKQLDAEPVVEQ